MNSPQISNFNDEVLALMRVFPANLFHRRFATVRTDNLLSACFPSTLRIPDQDQVARTQVQGSAFRGDVALTSVFRYRISGR